MRKAVNDMTEAYFLRAPDVAEMLQCSISKAHKLMAGWNKELAARGYTTMQGRIPRRYAMDRLGIEVRAVDEKAANPSGVIDLESRRAGALRGRNQRRMSS